MKLQALQERMHKGLEGIPQKDLITLHKAFSYFAQQFKFRVVAVIEREPGSEPSSGELASTIAVIKNSQVQAIFSEPQYPDRAAQAIARETGARVYLLDPAVTGADDPDAYITIMERNLKTLQEALVSKL